MVGRANETVSIDRSRLLRLLRARLQRRWIVSPGIVLQLTTGLFGKHRSIEKQFATQISQAFREQRLNSPAQLSFWLTRNELIRRFFRKQDSILIRQSLIDAIKQDQTGYRWPLPQINSDVELAEFLLLGSWRVLQWLTLPHQRRQTSVTHYHRREIPKRDGTTRWIESPTPILKRTQRMIATEIIARIPIHDAAFGFRCGVSIQDCSRQHVGREAVLRMDLQDFFGSIHYGRVESLFRNAGYPASVAAKLAMLCTAPGELPGEAMADTSSKLTHSRLPQGAPTSPALANVIAFAMDRRLTGLSAAAKVSYTRYADDLIFSFDSKSTAYAKRLATSVAVIAMEEGFRVNYRKTRLMRHGNSQRVLGMTVNERLNVPRKDYEELKAILHNCVRHGPNGQNRNEHPQFQQHLRGRIAHVASVHPGRGEKLMRSFNRIDWGERPTDLSAS
ncbi:MAG: reverse transcriptase family protein [Pirellulaceae bacterium]